MPRRGLDTEQVVDEACRLADEEGLQAVTLARVALALGVRAPSLYNHVSGHDDLLRLVSIRGLNELSEAMRNAAVGRSAADALTAVAYAYRGYALSHPGRYSATVGAPDPADGERTASAAAAVEVVVAVLGGWRLEGQAVIHAVRVVRSALHGFATIETDGGFGLPLDLDESFDQLIEMLIAGLARLG